MSLGRKAALSSVWMGLSSAAGQAVFFVVFAILARVLDKPEFGLVNYAAVFSNFFALFLRLGYGDALIQLKEMDDSHVSTAFWTSSGAGALMGVVSALMAWPIGDFFDKPELTPLIQVLSISCVLVGLKTIPTALLTRGLRFDILATQMFVANVISGSVGVWMALSGWGVWALVALRLGFEVSSVTMVWVASAYRPKFLFSFQRLKEMTGFSNQVFALNLINYCDQYLDQLLVGWKLSDADLGGYSVARRLIRTLTNATFGSFRRVSFSAFSQLQENRQKVAEAIYKSTKLVVLITYPVFLGIAVFASEAITVVFGSKWADVAPIVQGFCVLALYSATMSTFFGACKGMGRPEYVTRHRVLAVSLNVVLFFIAVPYGLVWVAIAYAAKAYLLHPLQIWFLRQATGIEYRRFYAALVGPGLAALVSVGAAAGADYVLRPFLPTDLPLGLPDELPPVLLAFLVIIIVHAGVVALAMPNSWKMIIGLARRTRRPDDADIASDAPAE